MQALQTALLLIRGTYVAGCRGSGPSSPVLPRVPMLCAVWWRGFLDALKLCHPCWGLLTINKSHSVSTETARAQLTIEWCLVACSSFINCIKTAPWAFSSLGTRKSGRARSVAWVGSLVHDNHEQSFLLPFVGASLTSYPCPKGFSSVWRIFLLLFLKCFCFSFTGNVNWTLSLLPTVVFLPSLM